MLDCYNIFDKTLKNIRSTPTYSDIELESVSDPSSLSSPNLKHPTDDLSRNQETLTVTESQTISPDTSEQDLFGCKKFLEKGIANAKIKEASDAKQLSEAKATLAKNGLSGVSFSFFKEDDQNESMSPQSREIKKA